MIDINILCLSESSSFLHKLIFLFEFILCYVCICREYVLAPPFYVVIHFFTIESIRNFSCQFSFKEILNVWFECCI